MQGLYETKPQKAAQKHSYVMLCESVAEVINSALKKKNKKKNLEVLEFFIPKADSSNWTTPHSMLSGSVWSIL